MLLFITLFIIFFYVIIIIVVIVIKITPDFCHKYRNDMQFPSFWVKIFFFNFLKNVILQFGPFLLSMPHIRTVEVFYAKQFPYLYFFCQDQQEFSENTLEWICPVTVRPFKFNSLFNIPPLNFQNFKNKQTIIMWGVDNRKGHNCKITFLRKLKKKILTQKLGNCTSFLYL